MVKTESLLINGSGWVALEERTTKKKMKRIKIPVKKASRVAKNVLKNFIEAVL